MKVSYFTNVSVEFPCSAKQVYEALCDLRTYLKWNSGLVYLSTHERLHEGLKYHAQSMVLGHINEADITVLELVPNKLIVLESKTGLVRFTSWYELKSKGKGCVLTCRLKLNFNLRLFNLAQPVAEAIAENWVAYDLRTLRSLLAGEIEG